MIRIRKKATAPIPSVLETKGKEEIEALKIRYDNGERGFKSKDFDSGIYGNKEVKNALIKIQNYKCCFCESIVGHISYGDVEHFRPKAGWVQSNEKLNKPGYYWLAYEWDNLFLSCQICNQQNKKSLFPLLNPAQRALSHHDNIENEQPVFIHPGREEVETLITFREEIPVPVNANERGKVTIELLGLDREILNEQRRKTLNLVRDIYELAKVFPDDEPDLKQEVMDMVKKYADASLLDETEYASMLRAFFRDNPVDF